MSNEMPLGKLGRAIVSRRQPSGAAGALVAYITAGDPNLAATEAFVEAFEQAGVAVVELGVPFSDPVADGPVNQRAAERALKSGTTLKAVLESVLRMRKRGIKVPIVLFTYYNPVYAFGLEAFAHQASVAGVDGVLPLDLPPEESVDFRRALGRVDVETIFLAAPTTPVARLSRIDEASSGFVYYVSRLGVTGVRSDVPPELAQELERVRSVVSNPIVVGFGLSTPEQVKLAAQAADGVVVGSAFVDVIEKTPSVPDATAKLKTFATSLVQALQGSAQQKR